MSVATNTAGKGSSSKAVIAPQSAFTTGIAGTEVLTFNSESIIPDTAVLEAEYLAGRVGREDLIASVKAAAGSIGGECVYDTIAGAPLGWEYMMKAALGFGQQDDTNTDNEYTPSNNLTESYTIGIDKGVSVWDTIGAKVNTLEISGAMGEKTLWNAGIVGRTVLRTGEAGIVNTAASIAALAPTAKPQLILLENANFYLRDIAAAITTGAASADKVAIQSFTLSIDNALSEGSYGTCDDGHLDPLFGLEPVRDGIRQVNLGLSFPRYHEDTWLDGFSAGTFFQGQFDFVLGTDQFSIYLPLMKIAETPTAPVDGPSFIQHDVTFACLINGGTNTFMTFPTGGTPHTIDFELGMRTNNARTAVL